jgi:anti-sigma B factor antagonist
MSPGNYPAESPSLPSSFQREYVGTIGLLLSWFNRQSHPGVTRLWRKGVMSLTITTNTIGVVIVVHLNGAIFFDEDSIFLRVHVKGLLERSRQIVLDLGNVTRIDSSGLGTLVALHVSARKVGGDIKLANPGNHIKEALRITRLVTVFDIFDRTEDAIISFNRAAAVG